MEEVTDTLADLTANVGSTGHNARIVCGSYVGTGTYGPQQQEHPELRLHPGAGGDQLQ